MMIVNNIYEHGEVVYLKTDKGQLQRIVTCVKVYRQGDLMYEISCGTMMSPHYDYELSREVNVLLTTTN